MTTQNTTNNTTIEMNAMNTTNNTTNSTFDLTPEEQLEAAKSSIKKQIAAKKIVIKDAKSTLRKIEKLDASVVTDKQQKIEAQLAVIAKHEEEFTELEVDLSGLERSKQDETEEKIQAALHVVGEKFIKARNSAAYIINDAEFVYSENFANNPEKLNVQMQTMKSDTFIEQLAHELGLCSWHLPPVRVKKLFSDMGRTFTMSRYSIDPGRWGQNKVYLPIEHMRPYFIDQMVLSEEQDQEAANSLKYFDWLMYSLSGNKKENQDHIEKWILHKIINYKKATTTPDIVIVGHVGGNGKGILQAIIRLMLPAMLSGKANSKTLNGNFNAIMLGKLIVFFDDQNTKEIPLDVVKELAGSDTMIFEPKGKDQYEGEKTHSSAWFSQTPPFRLTPAGQEGGVDRRFSVMATNITFLESIRKHMEEETGEQITVEESKDLAEIIVSNHLLNRVCIAKWFKHLMVKHPEVTPEYTLKALHGQDYHYFLQRQETTIESIFKRLITPVLEAGGCVPLFVIKELTRHFDEREMSDKRISKLITELSTQYKLDLQQTRTRIDILSKGGAIKKQCVVVHAKNWKDHSFDWSLVSAAPFEVNPMPGRELINKDALVFAISQIEVDEQGESEDDLIVNEDVPSFANEDNNDYERPTTRPVIDKKVWISDKVDKTVKDLVFRINPEKD